MTIQAGLRTPGLQTGTRFRAGLRQRRRWPVLGWRLELHRFWRDPVGYMSDVYSRYGLLSFLGQNDPQYVFSFSPELNRPLSDDSDLFHWAAGKNWTGGPRCLQILRASVSNMDGDEYKLRKVLMRPAFHHSIVHSAQDKIVNHTEQLLSRWRTGERRDVNAEVRRLVHDISMSVVLGLEDKPTVERIYQLVESVYAYSGHFLIGVLPYDISISPFRKLVRTGDEIVELMRSLIRKKRESDETPSDMLAMLMRSTTEQGESLDETEVISETYNIMGHDTTVSALMWCIILLALHPEARDRLVVEIDTLLRHENLKSFNFARLPYLDWVIKESLRLMPPQCFSRRFTTSPCKLGPLDLKMNTPIFLSSYITHRLPELYTDPLRFIPERWEHASPSPSEYFPFGAGAHYCPGRALALLEIKIVLAMLFQRYQLTLSPGQRIDRMPRSRMLLSPKGSVPMRVLPQGSHQTAARVTGDIAAMVAL